MDIVVKDANILIDLIHTGLDQHCRLLDMEFHTTQHVYREIREATQRERIHEMISGGELMVDSFQGIEYEKFLDLVSSCDGANNLSAADCSVIVLAERLNCRLLTSDQKLKRQAESRGLKVNGLLWIVDVLVEKGILTGQEMTPYLERYLHTNERAPRKEITKRITKYKE